MNPVQNEIIDKIKEFETIIIHRHVNPDPDALGSQGGLQKVLQHTFPEKKVYVVGEEVEGLIFLNCMDQVTDVVYEEALVIVCDTANIARISDNRFSKGKYIIKIDHHPDREPYGDLQWVDTSYSSTSEMITHLVTSYMSGDVQLHLDDAAAKLLYAGIVGDTGRFLYDNTKERTLRLASELLTYSFNPQSIYGPLYSESRATAQLKGYILQNFEVTTHGVAYMFLPQSLLARFQVSRHEADNLVNVLANIEGNHIWVFFVEGDEEIRVRIRSKECVINEVAYAFNGGGHPLASGATIQNTGEMSKMLEILDGLLLNK